MNVQEIVLLYVVVALRGLLLYMAYTGTFRWTGYGFWPFCPKQGIQSSLNMAHTIFSNPRSGTFAGL